METSEVEVSEMDAIEIFKGDREAYQVVFEVFCKSMSEPPCIKDKLMRIMKFADMWCETTMLRMKQDCKD